MRTHKSIPVCIYCDPLENFTLRHEHTHCYTLTHTHCRPVRRSSCQLLIKIQKLILKVTFHLLDARYCAAKPSLARTLYLLLPPTVMNSVLLFVTEYFYTVHCPSNTDAGLQSDSIRKKTGLTILCVCVCVCVCVFELVSLPWTCVSQSGWL